MQVFLRTADNVAVRTLTADRCRDPLGASSTSQPIVKYAEQDYKLNPEKVWNWTNCRTLSTGSMLLIVRLKLNYFRANCGVSLKCLHPRVM